MAGDGSVIIDILGNDKGLRKALSGLGSVAKKGMKVVATSITAASAALGGMAAYAVKVGSDFEAAMSKVEAISGASASEMDALAAKAKEMGATTKFSATESAEALQYMAMAGWKADQMISGLPGIMNLAAASGENLGLVSDIVTDALTAFGLKAEDAGHFADVLAKASSNSNTNVAMMGQTFKYVAPVAGALGYSVEDCAVAIGLMANSGIKADQAGTALRSMFTRLAKPTKMSSKYLDDLGITLTNASGQVKPLNELLLEMREKFAGLTAAQKSEYAAGIAGTEAMSGLLAIVNASSEDFDKLTASIEDSNGAAERMAEIMNDNLQGQITILKSGIEGLAITFYESVDSGLKGAVAVAAGYVERLNGLFHDVNVDIGSAAFQAQVEEYQAAGLTLEDAMKKTSDGIKSRQFLQALPEELGNILADMVTRIANAAPAMLDAGTQMISSLLQGISDNAPQLAQGALGIIGSLANAIITLLPQLVQTGTDLVLQFAQGMTDALPELTPSGIQMVGGVVQSILGNLDQMISAGTDMILEFAKGLVQALPELVPKGVEMIGGLIRSIVGNLDQIISAGIDVLVAFGEGMINALPQLIEQAPRIVISICDAINNNASKLLVSAAKLLLELGVGLIKAIPTLIKNIPVIIEAIVKAFLAFNWLKLGGSLIKGLASGVKSAGSFISNEAKNVSNLVIRHIKELPAKLLQIGQNMIKGLANGIKAGAKWAVSAIANLGASMLAGLKNALSGKAAQTKAAGESVGESVADGVGHGIKQGRKTVAKAVESAADAASEAAVSADIGGSLASNIADGISSGGKAASSAAKDLSKSVLDAATSWVEDKQFYNQLSAEDEAAYWEEIKRTAKLGADELAEVDKKIYTARANASKQLLDDAANYIERKKFYNQSSAADEIKTWQDLLSNEKLLANEREQVERNLYTAKQTLADEQKKLYDDYQKELDDRTSALEGFAGVFDSVAEKGKTSGRELLNNLKGQVSSFKQWQDDLTELSSRGFSDELLDEFRELGPKAAGEIKALRQLTEDEIKEYNQAFADKAALAKDQAEAEVGPMQIPVELTYDGENVQANAETVLAATTETINSMVRGVEDQIPAVSDITELLAQAFVDTADSFKNQYYNVGRRMIDGVLAGIQAGKSGLINGIVSVLRAAVQAAKEAMDINSPSRVWADQIGSQMAAGAGVGFVSRMRGVGQQMQAALSAETARMSAQVSVSAARSTATETAGSRVETYYQNNVIEKTPKIVFDGEMAAFARVITPSIITEIKRQGGNLIKGKGPAYV